MFDKVAKLGGLFAQGANGHPLADPRELKRIVAELPKDNAFKALDEIAGWLESLLASDGIPVDRVYEAAQQLDEAAQPLLKRLSREYLHTPRLPRNEEKRLWSINCGFWTLAAAVYERCLPSPDDKGRVPESAKWLLPALSARLISAYGARLKWEQFHYGPSHNDVWRGLGQALLLAEQAGVAGKAVAIPGGGGSTSPQQEYVKAMVFQAASMDSLLPLEIELAERLIAHFLSGFIFSVSVEHDSVYWVDLAQSQPPLRMARMPNVAVPTQRFFKPGSAHAAMLELLGRLERGGDVPAEINLGGQYYGKTLVPVLRHLTAYLAPVPPQRRHDRHRVKHRLSVLNGLINAFVVFSREFGGRPAGLQIESWVVDNVSRGGFGAVLSDIPAEWLKIGALVAMQPEGGDNWLLGVVRRYHRESDKEARVGIESLARQVFSTELKPRTASSYAAVAGIPSLVLQDGNEAGEVRVVLPPSSFDLRESLEYQAGDRLQQLLPVALIEQTSDYELARYRIA